MSTQPARALEAINYRNVNSNVADEIHFQLKEKTGQNIPGRCCPEQQCGEPKKMHLSKLTGEWSAVAMKMLKHNFILECLSC